MFALIANGMLLARSGVSYVRARFGSELGQDLIEYALLGGLIAAGVAILGGVLLGTGAFTDMANAIADCINFGGNSSCV